MRGNNMSIEYFNQYRKPGLEAEFTGIPMAVLYKFKHYFGSDYRIRYRGPRMATRFQDGRYPSQCSRDCIKARATHFSAYKIKKVLDNSANSCIMATQYNEREKIMANITILINGEAVDLQEFEALVTKIKQLEAQVNELKLDNQELEEANTILQAEADELSDILLEKNVAINRAYLILEQFSTIS